MAIDSFFSGGGVGHSETVMRRLLSALVSDEEGVAVAGDLKVVPLAPTGAGVRVLRGTGYMQSRYVDGQNQAYMGVVYQAEEVAVAPAGAKARSDLVIMRAEDPFEQGSPWPKPVAGEELTYQTVHIRVISGVPANTTSVQSLPGHQNDTAITLARIDLKAQDGAVAVSNIKDLRQLAKPREKRILRGINLTNKGTGREQITATTAYPTGGQTWPQEAEDAGILDIEIPPWATHMTYVLQWTQLNVWSGNGNASGHMWLQIGSHNDPDVWRGDNSQWDMDEKAATHNTSMFLADSVAIPARLRGKTKRFYPRATRRAGVALGTPACYWASNFTIDVSFEERAV